MANTLNGVNLTRISQLSLDALVAEMAPLRQFVTDFSQEVRTSGEAVTTRFAGPVTVQDIKAGRTPGNTQTTARTVTLDQWDGVVIGFDDLERTYSEIELIQLFIRPAMSALVEGITEKALANITTGNGYTSSVDVAAANFDADTMADLAQTLTENKVSREGRSALLSPAYYGGLVKDNSIQSEDTLGTTGALSEHRVRKVHGIAPVEYNGTIPENSETLKGFVGHRSALCIAARGVATPPPGTWAGRARNIVEPVSGLPIQLREYYDGSQLVYEWHCNFGTSHGIPGAGIRIIDTP